MLDDPTPPPHPLPKQGGKCARFKQFPPPDAAGVDAGTEDAQLGSFGDVLMDVEAGSGWGHALAWSPSGMQLPQTFELHPLYS